MTKASLKASYDASSQTAFSTLALNVGDVKLKVSCTDRTFEDVSEVSLGIEKPGVFIADYDLHKKAARFQLTNSAKVYGKQVKLTYIHPQKANATVLESTISFNPANKLTGKYGFHSGKGSVKYSYLHSSGVTLEPSYDFHSEAWSFAASRKLPGDNTLKATYEASKKALGLEWIRESRETGFFKVLCTVHRSENKPPKVVMERTWNFEI